MIRPARHGRSSSWPSWPNTCVPHYAISLTGRKGPYMRTRDNEQAAAKKPPHPEVAAARRPSKERRSDLHLIGLAGRPAQRRLILARDNDIAVLVHVRRP